MNENELLLTSLLKCRRADLYTNKHDLTSTQQNEFLRMKNLLLDHQPIQYVLGSWDFMGLTLRINKHVLIPRPETELLAESLIKEMQKRFDQILEILDIGTGSGNIVISLAHHARQHHFTAIDISSQALALAKENARQHHVDDQIDFLRMDALEDLHCLVQSKKKFDLIVSNPPYIPSKDIAKLSLEVQNEPRLALDGGQDGLIFFRMFSHYVSDLLSPNGMMFLEIGDGQECPVKEIFQSVPGIRVHKTLRDHAGIQRILILERAHNG